MAHYLFFKPLDVLFFRGNESFGGTGEHGESLMPPWPSVFSGALRSAILAGDPKVQLSLVSEKTDQLPSVRLQKVIGTPRNPGSFRVTFVALGTESGELFLPAPADLVVWGSSREGIKAVKRLTPIPREELAPALEGKMPFCSYDAFLSHIPVLSARRDLGKPSSGWWLTREGMETYLNGDVPEPRHFVHATHLWKTEMRLGIARSRESFTVDKGRLYTTTAVALAPGPPRWGKATEASWFGAVGFVVGVEGVDEDLFPERFVVRLGGDGHGCEVTPWRGEPLQARELDERFVAVCVTPCMSPQGWLPPGLSRQNGAYVTASGAFLAAAVVGRPQVVSGWDLAAHAPKPAQAAIPAGSVFYFQGKPEKDLFAEGLKAWLQGAKDQVKPEAYVWRQRLAEGFNNVLMGSWPKGNPPSSGVS
ncbi:type III-B CRISPR module-associated Cmr3 family protein [Thermogutta sp.]|uniref:type III-B CRISPR module-associated Cmr3 family protein n=1 Tax=Thermogutta sp. TaxID=1962930 RepID=UPI0032201191